MFVKEQDDTIDLFLKGKLKEAMWNLNLGLDKVLFSFCGVIYIVICLTYVNYNKVVLSVHVDLSVLFYFTLY